VFIFFKEEGQDGVCDELFKKWETMNGTMGPKDNRDNHGLLLYCVSFAHIQFIFKWKSTFTNEK